MICRLTGMDVTNASMYDGATALAEAVLMACRARGLDRFAVSEGVNGAYLEVLRTYAWASSLEMEVVPVREGITDAGWFEGRAGNEFAACVFQSPNRYGLIEDARMLSAAAHEKGAYSIQTATEALSLALLARPGDCGVDIFAGEGQSFGNYPGFGGPLLGLLAAKKDFLRRMPGRLVGRTTDEKGREAFVLTLQAREQHIRREKATSNICSNEGLCALRAVIYLSLLGDNLRQLARLNHARASLLLRLLEAKGARRVFSGPFFNEFCVEIPDAETFRRLAADSGMLAGTAVAGMGNVLLMCATECTSPAQIERLAALL
jgi:glycine dehydrogenase subunit 1